MPSAVEPSVASRDARAKRQAWVRLHRYLGVGIGAWFALVGLTGAILVYEDAIDAWLNPTLLSDTLRGPVLPPDDILARADNLYPLGHVERLRMPAAPGEVYRATIRTAPFPRGSAQRVEATFSPVSGALLGRREAEAPGVTRPYLVRGIYEFHRNVLLGAFGSNIVGIAGLLLLASAVSGVIAALPRRRDGWRKVVSIKLRSGATRTLFDVHRSTGTLLAALLILAAATGSTLVYVNYVRDIVGLFSRIEPFPVVPWRQRSPAEWPRFEAIAASIGAAYPALSISEVRFPAKFAAGYQFYLKGPRDRHRYGDTLVWVHPATGEVLLERGPRTRSAGEGFMHWLYPLHSGTAFGAPGQVAMFVTGLLPFLLVLTGLWVWLRKRRAARVELLRRNRTRKGVAPAEVERPRAEAGPITSGASRRFGL